MTTGQTIEAKITVDAKQAQAEVVKFTGRLSEVEEKAKSSNGAMVRWQERMKDVQSKMGPSAAAISSVASALGQTGGEVAKVVNAAGQMAAAFGAGGPWAVAIVGATLLADEYAKAEAEIAANAKIADEALKAFGANLTQNSGKGLEFIKQKADEAARAVRDFGKTSEEVTIANARLEIADTERRIRGLDEAIQRRERNIGIARQEMNDPAIIKSRQDIIDRLRTVAEETTLMKETIARRNELTATLKNQQDETRRLITAQRTLRELEDLPEGSADLMAAAGGGIRTTGSSIAAGMRQAEIDRWNERVKRDKAERQAQLAKIKEDRDLAAMRADAIFKAEEDRAKESARRLKEIADQRRREEEEARRAEEAARQAELRDQEQKFTALATGMATAVGRFATEAAMGQEEALANLLSAAAAQAGGMITLEGGKILAAGIAGALVGNPAAPGQIVGGAALVAAGTAVQTGGPAAVQSLLGMAGMGAGKASGGDSGAARDRGAAPRSPRGGGDGGPLVINVSYGVGGPLPEDTAREIAKVMKTGNRRRGAA